MIVFLEMYFVFFVDEDSFLLLPVIVDIHMSE